MKFTEEKLEKLKLTEGKKLKRAATIRFGKDASDLRFHEVPESGLVDGLVESQFRIVELIKNNPKISKKVWQSKLELAIQQLTNLSKH